MNTRLQLSRWLLYGVLLLAALFFLGPLYVMLATSFKDAEQIREGNLLSLPHGLNLESWTLAWSTACTGADCRGLQPYFWGVAGLTIQEAALGNQSVNLLKGEFLFPEQTYVSFPGNALLEARSFSESWVEGGKPNQKPN